MLVVTYHAIDERPSPVATPRRRFEQDLQALRRAGFALVSLDDCVDWLAGSRQLPARSIALTFDDGYQSVVREALPVLVRERVPCTVFVISGRLGSSSAWPGQWPGLPTLRLLDEDELRRLADAGVSIGAHTWSHSRLIDHDDETVQFEIVEAADRLERLVGRPVSHFAYPYGIFGERERRIVAHRFRGGFAAAPGVVRQGADRAALPRLDPHDLRVALSLGLGGDASLAPYLAVRGILRRVRRQVETVIP